MQDRVEGIELALVVHDRVGTGEEHLVLPAQLIDQAKHVAVAGKPVMVELLNRPIPVRLFKARSQAAGVVGGFENGHLMAGAHQVVGGSQAAKAGAQDGGIGLFRHQECSIRSANSRSLIQSLRRA